MPCSCPAPLPRLATPPPRTHPIAIGLPIVDDKPRPTIALVVWRELLATWTYHRTRQAAAALAPTDAPYSIVDVARKPWIRIHQIGKGTPITPKQLQRLTDAAIAAVGDRQMTPHPGGLAGRTQDALNDAELIAADPHATSAAKQAARQFAAALVAAMAAED